MVTEYPQGTVIRLKTYEIDGEYRHRRGMTAKIISKFGTDDIMLTPDPENRIKYPLYFTKWEDGTQLIVSHANILIQSEKLKTAMKEVQW